MPRRCTPGVFCIENYTIFTIFCILIVALAYIFLSRQPLERDSSYPTPHHQTISRENEMSSYYGLGTLGNPSVRANPSFSYNDQSSDILLNPYSPPVNNEQYLVPTRDTHNVHNIHNVPINIRTQGVDAAYRQVGILTSQNGKEQILALMGRPLITNRDNWQYYTMSERNNIKLPVSVKGKSCMNQYGCDKIYDGDTIYVEGYKNVFNATIYDSDVLRYIPVL
jgi:hypothetical protein